MRSTLVFFALSLEVMCAQQATVAPAAAAQPLRPGMFWGTVISRGEYVPLEAKERWSLYWRQTYGRPTAYLGSSVSALVSQLNNEPPEWGQGMEGYSKRFANRFARSTIRNTVTAAGSAALGYEVRYVKCDCKGFGPRFGHAIAWNFLTLNRDGKTVLNTPRIGASFASEFIGNRWMPAGYNTAGDAMRSGAIQLGVSSLFNAIREFAPRRGK